MGNRSAARVYDKDRIDPVEPDAALHLNRQLLDAFPKGYRHRAYLQTRIGYTVKKDILCLVTPDSRGASITPPRYRPAHATLPETSHP
jgi:hypothetical protein